MQTFLSRIGDLLKDLLPLAGQPAAAGFSAQAASRHDGRAGEDRLPERDESYYWAMHAHW